MMMPRPTATAKTSTNRHLIGVLLLGGTIIFVRTHLQDDDQTLILSSSWRRFLASSSFMDETATTLPPLFPLQPLDYLGFGSAIVGLILAAGGGIGGGGILVPIYILALEFPVKHAIPLASVTVLGTLKCTQKQISFYQKCSLLFVFPVQEAR